jgi:glycine oxidase
MARIDVTIRGAGVLGLACAWMLCSRGARVAVADPAGPGAGASGGVLGALAPHVPEAWNAKKQFQLESLLASEAFWREIETASGLPTGYGRHGRLQPIADAAALERAHERAVSAARLWGDAAQWEVVPAATADFAPPSPTGLLIRDTLSARIDPAGALVSLAAALRSRGVAIGPEAPEAGVTLWATGAAGLEALTAAFGRPVGRGVKGQAALLGHAVPVAPQVFAEGLHIVPHANGTTAIGSTDEREFDDPTRPDDKLEALIARACLLMPVLTEAPVLARWAGLRPRARSRAPILGDWPGRPGHYIANGGFKIGFGLAPKIARTLADLILEGHDTIPDGFRLEDNF